VSFQAKDCTGTDNMMTTVAITGPV